MATWSFQQCIGISVYCGRDRCCENSLQHENGTDAFCVPAVLHYPNMSSLQERKECNQSTYFLQGLALRISLSTRMASYGDMKNSKEREFLFPLPSINFPHVFAKIVKSVSNM